MTFGNIGNQCTGILYWRACPTCRMRSSWTWMICSASVRATTFSSPPPLVCQFIYISCVHVHLYVCTNQYTSYSCVWQHVNSIIWNIFMYVCVHTWIYMYTYIYKYIHMLNSSPIGMSTYLCMHVHISRMHKSIFTSFFHQSWVWCGNIFM